MVGQISDWVEKGRRRRKRGPKQLRRCANEKSLLEEVAVAEGGGNVLQGCETLTHLPLQSSSLGIYERSPVSATCLKNRKS